MERLLLLETSTHTDQAAPPPALDERLQFGAQTQLSLAYQKWRNVYEDKLKKVVKVNDVMCASHLLYLGVELDLLRE